MKKRMLSIICIFELLLCGCANDQSDDNLLTSTEIINSTASSKKTETVLTENTTVASNYDATKSTTLSDDSFVAESSHEYSRSDEIIDFITSMKIYDGLFYDFDRDGIPELLNAIHGIDDYSYEIYRIDTNDFTYMGEYYASTTDKAIGAPSLYRNKTTDEYFYFGVESTINYGTETNDIFCLVEHRVKDNKVETTCVGRHEGDWDGEKYYYTNITFNGKTYADGYYDLNEIRTAFGIDEYLLQFEKIEEVHLEPQWCCTDDNLENTVRKVLESHTDIYQ